MALPPVRVEVVAASELEAVALSVVLRSSPGFQVLDPVIASDVDTWAVVAAQPDVVVIGAAVGGYEWLLDVAAGLSSQRPGIGLVAVVDRPRSGWLQRLAVGGISGLAELSTTAQQLRTAVMAVAGGHDWMSAGISAGLARIWALEDSGLAPEELSPRELAVLRILAEGADNAQVAGALGISPHTVANHVQSICTKLRASSRLHAVAIGLRWGLVDPS